MQLRSFLAELGCLTTSYVQPLQDSLVTPQSNILAFPEAHNLLDPEGKLIKDEETWNNRTKRCFDQVCPRQNLHLLVELLTLFSCFGSFMPPKTTEQQLLLLLRDGVSQT